MSPHIGYRIVPLLSATVPRYPHVVHRPDADLYFMLVKPWNWHSKIEDTRCSTCLLRSPVYITTVYELRRITHIQKTSHTSGVHPQNFACVSRTVLWCGIYSCGNTSYHGSMLVHVTKLESHQSYDLGDWGFMVGGHPCRPMDGYE